MAEHLTRRPRRKTIPRLLLAAALTVGATTDTRSPDVIERQVSEAALDPSDVKVITANVLGFESYSHEGRSNLPSLLKTITRAQPDIICFQEFNPDREPKAIDDLAKLGYNVFFAATVRQDHDGKREGNAVAAKGAIDRHKAHALPTEARSIPREVLVVDVRTELGDITVANTHLSLDPHERRRQAESIDDMRLGQHIDCGDYNEDFGMLGGHFGSRSYAPGGLLNPNETQSTSVFGTPTHATGMLIDRISVNCGERIPDSIRVLPIDSDHSAPMGSFDLRDCFARIP